MAVKIFYSWQSDQKQNRNFIRSALDLAIKELRQDLSLEEAKRDIVADQDTLGVPGSPSIADAILQKIRNTEVFVADLTFIDKNTNHDGRQTPNPNVMLEYGYALHALGDGKVIGVFNEAHGSPKDLPFDLAHRRWPIRFNLSPDSTSETRKIEKKSLSEILKKAIRGIVSQYDERSTVIVAPFVPAEPGDGVGRLRHAQFPLCISSGSGKPIWLRPGPYSFFRLIPLVAMDELGEVEAYQIAQRNLQPMAGMRVSWVSGRFTTGAVSYWTANDEPELAWDASQLFLTRELWANDFYHVMGPDRERSKEYGFSYIPTGALEEIFIDTFINFVNVASKNLAITPPVRIVAGLANVQGVKLAVDSKHFGYDNFAGSILRDNFVWEAKLEDWSADPFDFLLPFFNKIYDIAGIQRPADRTIGRRQR